MISIWKNRPGKVLPGRELSKSLQIGRKSGYFGPLLGHLFMFGGQDCAIECHLVQYQGTFYSYLGKISFREFVMYTERVSMKYRLISYRVSRAKINHQNKLRTFLI